MSSYRQCHTLTSLLRSNVALMPACKALVCTIFMMVFGVTRLRQQTQDPTHMRWTRLPLCHPYAVCTLHYVIWLGPPTNHQAMKWLVNRTFIDQSEYVLHSLQWIEYNIFAQQSIYWTISNHKWFDVILRQTVLSFFNSSRQKEGTSIPKSFFISIYCYRDKLN